MRVQLISQVVNFDDLEFSISKSPVVLGRSVQADVQLIHPLVSRLHCEWSLVDEELMLRDLGSTNQTIVNGDFILQATLQSGDRILLGDVAYIVETVADDSTDLPPAESESEKHLLLVDPEMDSEVPTERLAIEKLSASLEKV